MHLSFRTQPAPSVGLNPSRTFMNVIEIEEGSADHESTILSVPHTYQRNIDKNSYRRTCSIIPGITRFTVVRGSRDLSCPKQQTIYRDHTTSCTNQLAVESLKHERVCLHWPESSRSGSIGTGVGVLTLGLRNLCK